MSGGMGGGLPHNPFLRAGHFMLEAMGKLVKARIRTKRDAIEAQRAAVTFHNLAVDDFARHNRLKHALVEFVVNQPEIAGEVHTAVEAQKRYDAASAAHNSQRNAPSIASGCDLSAKSEVSGT
jgi:hypothetical protein